jgi:hypothetical protein
MTQIGVQGFSGGVSFQPGDARDASFHPPGKRSQSTSQAKVGGCLVPTATRCKLYVLLTLPFLRAQLCFHSR